ncbi:MAG: LamG domain-containing protein [candidate division Zixibacteria bacterium]|nr:LamG domain-containing protein [candidate division Zixibacteria bacterium]
MIKIYKNEGAGAIFIEDDNGAQFFNSIQAVRLDPTNSTNVSIYDNVKDLYLIYEEDYTFFVDENGAQWGTDAQTTENALNTIFTNSGSPTGQAPTITSSLSVDLELGQTLNYELQGDYIVGVEWDFSLIGGGIVNVEGNVRKILGGSTLALGSYSVPVKAINYNGFDSQTLTINVINPSFVNTKSLDFQNNDWLFGAGVNLQDTFARTGNGSGSSDAWSISFWFKGGTNNSQSQTIFYFGSSSFASGFGHIYLRYRGGSDSLELRYGTNFNFLKLITPNNTLPSGNWKHVLVTYDGGTTGAASGSVTDYYSRFNIFIDGVLQTTTNSNSNFGFTGSIPTDFFRFGRSSSSQYMRNGCRLDYCATWNSDQSANISSIYGPQQKPSDLLLLPNPPNHCWPIGEGSDAFPFLFDIGTSANTTTLQMVGMNQGSFVNDVKS